MHCQIETNIFQEKTTHHQNTWFLTWFAGVCVHAKITRTGSVGGKKETTKHKRNKTPTKQIKEQKKSDQQCVVTHI